MLECELGAAAVQRGFFSRDDSSTDTAPLTARTTGYVSQPYRPVQRWICTWWRAGRANEQPQKYSQCEFREERGQRRCVRRASLECAAHAMCWLHARAGGAAAPVRAPVFRRAVAALPGGYSAAFAPHALRQTHWIVPDILVRVLATFTLCSALLPLNATHDRPGVWGLTLASSTILPPASLVLVFAGGAFLMRSAGCVVNDL